MFIDIFFKTRIKHSLLEISLTNFSISSMQN